MPDREPLEKIYEPRSVEAEIYRMWEEAGAFASKPSDPPTPHDKTFTIVIPPPNVTGALHLGHALNNTLQDILIRYHRMRGFNTLWQPGTDHAGIATQAVVERRIRETEGKTRYQLGATKQECRDELVRRIWQWKDDYEKRILSQLKLMGCSCDWSRTRFTLDEGLSKAVRHMFFKLFKDGLIFRGKRLVNWDTQLQTAVSDDEVYHDTVKGHFWHIKYPVISLPSRDREGADIDPSCDREGVEIDPSRDREGADDEPEYVIIATTRPETMLGDTAVAVHPDPEGFFAKAESQGKEMWGRLSGRSSKEAVEIKRKLDALAARRESHLPLLVKLRDMARAGRKLRLPLVDREIPLIMDEWADPTLGSGCVKITPAHDPNDYEVGLRHSLPMINVLAPDGTIAPIIEPDTSAAPMKPGTSENANSHKYAGLTFTGDGRNKVVADLEALGLLHAVEEREHEIGHSDRSKFPIEPYLSDQWFIKTNDLSETQKSVRGSLGLTLPDGTTAPGLAQAAMDAVTDGRVQVFPSRYAKSYLDWLSEKRDWCISRQLWWGHRISIWHGQIRGLVATDPDEIVAHAEQTYAELEQILACLAQACSGSCSFWIRPESDDAPASFTICAAGIDGEKILEDITSEINARHTLAWVSKNDPVPPPPAQILISDPRYPAINKICGLISALKHDPDVLDTWFSSALWPFSTLGWPDETPHLKQYYPGSVLCTSRDIITNWVARMVMFGLYALGKVPFDHVYIHPKILDGRGETMSKSKGNGVDPVDVIHTHGADALRYAMADLCTETQDIRMPVEYICPHCGGLVEQGIALKTEEQARKSRGEKLDHKLQPADCQRVTCTNKDCNREFATQWADVATKEQFGLARETSDKFDIGRNFCNKLWNAARFAFMNLEGAPCGRLDVATLPPEDRWILARLSQTIRSYHECIAAYRFSASVSELREFFWDSLCDWYIELTKPRMSDDAAERRSDGGSDPVRQVLAFCIDQILRLFHPTIPFITERLWQQLGDTAPRRGFPGIAELKTEGPLILAEFPPVIGYPAFDDPKILETFADLQDATRGVRDIRAGCGVSPKERVTVTVVVPSDHVESFRSHAHIVQHMAGIETIRTTDAAKRPPNAGSIAIRNLRIYVHDISDDKAERARIEKQLAAMEKQIAGKESKLSNEKFIARADPEVVSAERQRLAELLAQQTTLQEHLRELTT